MTIEPIDQRRFRSASGFTFTSSCDSQPQFISVGDLALATFRKGQTVMVHTASYVSRTPRAPKEATVEKTTKAGEVHVAGWEFPFSASSGRQIIPAGHDKPLTSTAWIEI